MVIVYTCYSTTKTVRLGGWRVWWLALTDTGQTSHSMQVTLLKKDLLTAEEFFFGRRSLTVRVVDPDRNQVKFRLTAEPDDHGNFVIKTRGMFRGRTAATYRLPRSLGDVEELYGIVGEGMNYILTNLIERDRAVLSRLFDR